SCTSSESSNVISTKPIPPAPTTRPACDPIPLPILPGSSTDSPNANVGGTSGTLHSSTLTSTLAPGPPTSGGNRNQRSTSIGLSFEEDGTATTIIITLHGETPSDINDISGSNPLAQDSEPSRALVATTVNGNVCSSPEEETSTKGE
ncbi:2358_t:CDS:2, partial [Acaulospora colombiana]